jgi:hypothetical protein
MEIKDMKKLIVFALVVLAGLGSASLASAQERQLRGQIPFGFIAGSARLPAGDYRLTYDMSGLLTLHNVDNGHSEMALAQADRGIKDGTCALIFARYGDQYFLKQSKCDAGNANFFVPTSRLEKRAVERAALDHPSEQILVAMK